MPSSVRSSTCIAMSSASCNSVTHFAPLPIFAPGPPPPSSPCSPPLAAGEGDGRAFTCGDSLSLSGAAVAANGSRPRHTIGIAACASARRRLTIVAILHRTSPASATAMLSSDARGDALLAGAGQDVLSAVVWVRGVKVDGLTLGCCCKVELPELDIGLREPLQRQETRGSFCRLIAQCMARTCCVRARFTGHLAIGASCVSHSAEGGFEERDRFAVLAAAIADETQAGEYKSFESCVVCLSRAVQCYFEVLHSLAHFALSM